jgi:hypothetical protein
MPRSRRFDPRRVIVTHLEDRKATWDWVRRPVRGVESLYEARDENYDRLNRWVFVVQQPSGPGPVIVRTHETPSKRVWGSVGRSSIAFVRATKSPYRRDRYCKVTLADPSGSHTKIVIRKGDERALPGWVKVFASHIKLKQTVTTTRGRDGLHKVLLVGADDHAAMIRAFFAFKVWVLEQRHQVVE